MKRRRWLPPLIVGVLLAGGTFWAWSGRASAATWLTSARLGSSGGGFFGGGFSGGK